MEQLDIIDLEEIRAMLVASLEAHLRASPESSDIKAMIALIQSGSFQGPNAGLSGLHIN